MNPTLILQCRAPGLFIAKMIFREMFSALRNSVSLRHVTSRFVTVNLFSNKRTPNGYYVPPWVNFKLWIVHWERKGGSRPSTNEDGEFSRLDTNYT